MTHRRIGLFGGSFDPVHQAHLALARAAVDQLALDELRLMPAGQPWQKARGLTPVMHRVAMLEHALADAGLGAAVDGRCPARWCIERCELDRTGPTYTIDTLRTLQAGLTCAVGQPGEAEAEWFLLIGQDQLARFDTWRDWPEILARVTLAVAGRAGEAACPPAALLAWFDAHPAHPRPQAVDLPPMAHSATALRARLALVEAAAPATGRARRLAPEWLSPAVADYIDRHGLYATPTVSSPQAH